MHKLDFDHVHNTSPASSQVSPTLGVADLRYPWEAPGAEVAERVEATTRAWVLDRGLVSAPLAETKFDPVNVGLLTCLCFKEAPLERLELLSQLLAWIFLKDDQFDEGPAGESVDRLSHVLREFDLVLRGHPAPRDTATLRTLEELSDRLRAEAVGGEWFRWFAQSMADFWFRGLLGEAKLKAQAGPPSVDAYLRMRVHSIGVLPFLDLVELGEGFALPRAIAAQPEIVELRLLASKIIALANDVFSYEKERRVNDPNNYVHLLCVHAHRTVAEAVDLTVREHDRLLGRFLALCSEVPSYGELDADVAHYVEGMRAWMRGALDWQMASMRYAEGRTLLGEDA